MCARSRFFLFSLKRRLAQGHLAMISPLLPAPLPFHLTLCAKINGKVKKTYFLCVQRAVAGQQEAHCWHLQRQEQERGREQWEGEATVVVGKGVGGTTQKPFGHSPLKRQLKISARQPRARRTNKKCGCFPHGTHTHPLFLSRSLRRAALCRHLQIIQFLVRQNRDF